MRKSVRKPVLAAVAGFIVAWLLTPRLQTMEEHGERFPERGLHRNPKTRQTGSIRPATGMETVFLLAEDAGKTVDALLASPFRDREALLAAVRFLARENPAEAVWLIAKLNPASASLREALVAELTAAAAPGDLAEWCGMTAQSKGPGVKPLLKALAGKWGRTDFPAALAWSFANEDLSRRAMSAQAVLTNAASPGTAEWNAALTKLPSPMRTDAVRALIEKLPPEEACAWLRQHFSEHDKWEECAIAALRKAETPAAALETAERFGWLDAGRELTKSLREWQSREDPENYRAALAAETDPERARLLIESGIQGLMSVNEAAGLEVLRDRMEHFDHASLKRLAEKVTDLETFGDILRSAEKMDPSLRFTALCALSDRTAANDPAAARALLEELAVGDFVPAREDLPEYRAAMEGTLQSWVKSGAPGAEVVEWAKSLPPGPAQDSGLESSVLALVTHDNTAAMSAALALADPNLRMKNLAIMAAVEPEWRKLAPELTLTPEELTDMENLASMNRHNFKVTGTLNP